MASTDDAAMNALFDSDSEDGQDEPKPRKPSDSDLEDDIPEDEGRRARPQQRRAADNASDDEEGADGRPSRSNMLAPPMEIEAPLLPLPPSGQLHMLRTTNIVGIQPRAFDPDTYEKEEETFIDDAGRRRVRLAHNAVMRWRVRHQADGTEARESNARFVRWSDGSLQLFLGDEVLDVTCQDIASNNNYLFAVHPGLIQGQAQLDSKLALRPATLESKLHKRLREAVDKRHGKVYKVVRHGGLQNPELDKARREAAEDEKIKNREQLQRKQERVMQRAYGRSKPARLSERYLEEDQDWEEDDGGNGAYGMDDGLTATQRARQGLGRSQGLDADQEAEAARRLQSAKRGAPPGAAGSKRRRVADSDDEEEEEEEDEEYGGGGEEEDEEAEYEFSDDEDDDEDRGRGASKKSKGGSKGGKPEGPSAGGSQAPKAVKARRGVVLSDEDDD